MAEENRSKPHLGEPSSASNCGNTKPHAPSLRDVGGDLKSERDIERGQQPLEKPRVVGPDTSDFQRDPKLVTWDGPDDRENPKNWLGKKKWITMSIVSLFTLISPVSSTMVAPALPSISAELHITSAFVSQLILSIFILAYAIGPLFLGPLSETYGRAPVLQLANLFYLAFNIGCGFAQTPGQLVAFRFLSGLGGSVPLVVGGGVLGDTFPAEKRGTAMAIYSLAPLLGPSIGPIFGGFIAENTTWRWVFYATSIATGIMQVAGVLWLRETYAPQILYKRAKKLRMTTGDPSHKTEEERKDNTLGKALQASLMRPFRLLATQPIIQVLALYMAYIYGLMYLMLSTFPTLWTDPNYYNESIGIGGLNYISLGLGTFLGAYLCAFLNDRIFKRLSVRNNDQGKPEYRLPLLSIVTVCVPGGLFIYGWTAQTHAHWIAPNVGTCVFAVGNMMTFQCMQTYIMDTYTQYAASAMAAVSVLRCLAAFGFPLFAPYMYDALSYGWGNSVLTFISLGIRVPAPIFLWKFGERLRKASPYATEKTEGD
ncbi:MFS general substrate transporter [Apiospora arundinis]